MMAIFEGPLSAHIGAWRHFLIWKDGETRSYLSSRGGLVQASAYNCDFYPAGTWEAGPPPDGQTFSPIKPELISALYGHVQTELPV